MILMMMMMMMMMMMITSTLTDQDKKTSVLTETADTPQKTSQHRCASCRDDDEGRGRELLSVHDWFVFSQRYEEPDTQSYHSWTRHLQKTTKENRAMKSLMPCPSYHPWTRHCKTAAAAATAATTTTENSAMKSLKLCLVISGLFFCETTATATTTSSAMNGLVLAIVRGLFTSKTTTATATTATTNSDMKSLMGYLVL